MAHSFSNFGYDGCSCMETLPDFCIICGDVCQNDPDYCDKHLSDKRDELQVEINFQLDDLGDYITAL